MRIAFTGTQSTGKTTLINALMERPEFKGYSVGTGWTRSVAALGYPMNDSGSTQGQKLVFMTHLYNLNQGHENFIMDRCLTDVMAYTMGQYDRDMIDDDTFFEFYRIMSTVFLSKECNYYDMVYYIPPEIPLVMDEIRSPDEHYRLEIDKNIRWLLEKFQVPYKTISGTIDQRVERVLKDIQ